MKDLPLVFNTAVNDEIKNFSSGNMHGKVTVWRQVDAKIDGRFSNLMTILPNPKFGNMGQPVEKTRNFFMASGVALFKYEVR